MRASSPPAIAGGEPIRSVPLPYGRHALSDADSQAVFDALASGSLTGGPGIARFEAGLAATCGAGHAVAVANGTAALHLAMAALGVGPGNEVIMPSLTFVATANAALYQGARPRFADVGDDRCLDPGGAAAASGPQTRAVVGVDYAGLPADYDAIGHALPRGTPVIADASHSLGGALRGRPVGSLAAVTTLSFHPVKHITSAEGGACVTDDRALAEEMRALRSHGMTSSAADREGTAWKYDVTRLGYNYRLSEMQAALGLSQLNRLAENVARRQALAARYDSLLRDVPGVGLPPRPEGRECAWHLYAIEVDAAAFGVDRDGVVDGLRAENIQATLHYPLVQHLAFYRSLGYGDVATPRAQQLEQSLVTLPLFPAMTESDQEDVVVALRRLSEWAAANPQAAKS